MHYLVTGAGVLGRALAQRLESDGHSCVLFDNKPGHGVRVVELTEPAAVRAALEPADGVFHTAAIHGFREATPIEFLEANVRGTWNLLDAMHDVGITRLVHSSTVGVYGEADERPRVIDADTSPNAAVDYYGTTKRMAEQVVTLLAPRYGIEAVSLRYGGFRQFLEATFGSLPAEWAASGAIVDLDDVVTANVHAMARLPLPRPAYLVIPPGGGDTSPYEVRSLAAEADLEFAFTTGYEWFTAAAT